MTSKPKALQYFILITYLLALGISESSSAADKSHVGNRQKVIDFDGDVVEGINKQPLDSLTQVSEKEKRRKKLHLYHKRRGFRTETQETLREMRYAE